MIIEQVPDVSNVQNIKHAVVTLYSGQLVTSIVWYRTNFFDLVARSYALLCTAMAILYYLLEGY